MTPDAYEPFRQAVRALGHKITPYRLGYAVGFADSPLPCPYTVRVSVDAFQVGRHCGTMFRKACAKRKP